MRGVLLLPAVFVALFAPTMADASTIVGQAASAGVTPSPCTRPGPAYDEAMLSAPYIVPAGGGVITEWRYKAGTGTPTITPRVYKADGAQLKPLAETPAAVMTAGTINRIPARIPVAGGEVIGFKFLGADSNCTVLTNVPADQWIDGLVPAPPIGGSEPLFISPSGHRLSLEATLEADADKDGFGDETQDECPADPAKQDCTAPAAPTIDKRPKRKTGSAKATFTFSSAEPGLAFACRLDKSAFQPCAGTRKVKKLKERKHTFRVHAIDASGNVGPDTAVSWRVTG